MSVTKTMTIHMTEEQHRDILRNAGAQSLQNYVLSSSLAVNANLHRLPLSSVKDIVNQLTKIRSELKKIADMKNSDGAVAQNDLIANIEALEEICRYLKV